MSCDALALAPSFAAGTPSAFFHTRRNKRHRSAQRRQHPDHHAIRLTEAERAGNALRRHCAHAFDEGMTNAITAQRSSQRMGVNLMLMLATTPQEQRRHVEHVNDLPVAGVEQRNSATEPRINTGEDHPGAPHKTSIFSRAGTLDHHALNARLSASGSAFSTRANASMTRPSFDAADPPQRCTKPA